MKEQAQYEIGPHTFAHTKNVTITKQLNYLPTLQSQKKSHELLNKTKNGTKIGNKITTKKNLAQ